MTPHEKLFKGGEVLRLIALQSLLPQLEKLEGRFKQCFSFKFGFKPLSRNGGGELFSLVDGKIGDELPSLFS